MTKQTLNLKKQRTSFTPIQEILITAFKSSFEVAYQDLFLDTKSQVAMEYNLKLQHACNQVTLFKDESLELYNAIMDKGQHGLLMPKLFWQDNGLTSRLCVGLPAGLTQITAQAETILIDTLSLVFEWNQDNTPDCVVVRAPIQKVWISLNPSAAEYSTSKMAMILANTIFAFQANSR